MTYRVIATDYDGTLAHDGRVDEPTLEALRAARDRGVRLIMVTGRELQDLFNTFDHSTLFDRIVAENGAVLYDPATQSVHPLAIPPPPVLIEALNREAIPLSVGHSIIATVEPHEHQVLAAIRDLGLEWHVIFNKGSVMALPADVTKATGLVPALEALQLTPAETNAKLAELKADGAAQGAKSSGGAAVANQAALADLAAKHGPQALRQIEGKCDPALDPTCK